MLRGEEATLQRLEEAWQQIAIQTEWKLEPVLHFCDDADVVTPTDSTVTLTTPTTPTTPVSNTQGNGHAPLKPDPSGFNLQQGAQKEQH